VTYSDQMISQGTCVIGFRRTVSRQLDQIIGTFNWKCYRKKRGSRDQAKITH